MKKYTFQEIIQNELDEFSIALLNEEDDAISEPWGKPTKEIKSKFPLWRNRTFNEERRTFNYHNEDVDTLFELKIINTELTRLSDELSKMYWQMDDALTMGELKEAYTTLAKIIGKTDFLKWLYINQSINKPLNIVINPIELVEWVNAIIGNPKLEKNSDEDCLLNGETSHLTNSEIGLLYFYLDKKITKTNAIKVKNKDGNPGSKLPEYYTLYCNKSVRINTIMSNTNKIETHLKRYKNILPILEKRFLPGFEFATKELNILKKHYPQYYSKVFTTG